MIQSEITTKENSSTISEGFKSNKLKNSTSPKKLTNEDNNDFSFLDEGSLKEDDEEASKMNKLLGNKKNFTHDVKQNENFKNDEMQLEKEDPLNTKSDKSKESKEPVYKLERFLKAIWSEFLNIIKYNLNKKLEKCKDFKTKQFIITNYKLYQGNPTILNGKKMLDKKIVDIFCDFEIKELNGIKSKKHNIDLRDKIYAKKAKKLQKYFPLTVEEIELYNYLERSVKDAIKEIYDDKSKELEYLITKYDDWDEKFKNEKKKEKGFKLLDHYGLIKYYEMNQNLFKTLVDEGKNLIKECYLKEYGGIEREERYLLYCPAGKYPKNRDVRKNTELLKKTVKELLTEGEDNNLKKNKTLIDKIYNIKDFPKTEKQQKLKAFLEMTISDFIKNHYNDNDTILL